MAAPVVLDNVTRCPNCRAALCTEGLGWNQPVLCAACRNRFILRAPGFVERLSRKAVFSLVLGLLSLVFVCFAGIPAIVLGAFALVDIGRSQGGLTGRRLAISGITTGILLGFFCAPVTFAFILPAVQMARANLNRPAPITVQLNDRIQLDNGLTVLLRPVPGTQNAAVLVLYSIGGDHDPEGQSGLAHLIEHLYVTAAAGAAPARTADDFMRKYPAGWNAQTGDQFTVIATVFPKDSLEAELEEAAARMGALRITGTDLDREKPRLIAEVENMFAGAPQLVAYNNARERIRPAPLGGRKGGLPDHVSAVTLEMVQERWRRFYKPKNATLVVGGAFDPANVQAMIAKHFASLPAGEPAPPAGDPGDSKFSTAVEAVPAKALPVGAGAELCVAYPAPPRDSELYPAFLVLIGRLTARAQQLDNSPNRFPIEYSALFDPSTLFVTIPVKPDESVDTAVARADSFLAEAVKPQVTAADRTVAKNRFSFELQTVRQPDAVTAQNLYGVAFTTGCRAILGVDTKDFGKVVDGVTAEQWGEVSRTILSADRRVVVVARPK